MQIAIDGRTIKQNPSGLGIWNLRLVQHLIAHDQVQNIFLLVSKNTNYDFDQDSLLHPHLITKKLKLIPTSQPYTFAGGSRVLFEQYELNRILASIQPDIYHATDSFGIPFFLNPSIKTVLTVHDLIPMTPYREMLSIPQYILFYLPSLYLSLTKADTIVAISDKTADDISSFFHMNPKRVSLIYDGVDKPKQQKTLNEYAWKSLQSKLKIQPHNYILYVGGFGKRRNVSQLIVLFSQLLKNGVLPQEMKLVLSGRIKGAKKESLANVTELEKAVITYGIEKNAVFLDYLDPIEKEMLILNCFCSFFLSLYEGFGLPPVEIALYKKPVIVSKQGIFYSYQQKNPLIIDNTGDLKSVYTQIAGALELIKDQKADEYINSMYNFVDQFSWHKMAQQYITLYSHLIHI